MACYGRIPVGVANVDGGPSFGIGATLPESDGKTARIALCHTAIEGSLARCRHMVPIALEYGGDGLADTLKGGFSPQQTK